MSLKRLMKEFLQIQENNTKYNKKEKGTDNGDAAFIRLVPKQEDSLFEWRGQMLGK